MAKIVFFFLKIIMNFHHKITPHNIVSKAMNKSKECNLLNHFFIMALLSILFNKLPWEWLKQSKWPRCRGGCFICDGLWWYLFFLFFELLLNSGPRIQTRLETVQFILIKVLKKIPNLLFMFLKHYVGKLIAFGDPKLFLNSLWIFLFKVDLDYLKMSQK